MKKFFGGKDNKEISDSHPTYVSPDGLTFAIWSFIYLFELILVVAQAIPSERTDYLMSQPCPLTGLDVRARLAMAFMVNGVWLMIWSNENYWAGLAVNTVYCGVLLSLHHSLNSVIVGLTESAVFGAGIAMNASW